MNKYQEFMSNIGSVLDKLEDLKFMIKPSYSKCAIYSKKDEIEVSVFFLNNCMSVCYSRSLDLENLWENFEYSNDGWDKNLILFVKDLIKWET